MQEKTYYLSPGLEVIALDEERLTLTLYGRRFTLRDESGLVNVLINAAGTGLNITALSEQHPYPLDAIASAIKSLVDAKFLTEQNSRALGDSTRDFLAHTATIGGRVSVDRNSSPATAQWRAMLVGKGQLAEAIGQALGQLGIELVRCEAIADILPGQSAHTMLVACADDENHDFFRQVNHQAISAMLPCLYIALDWQVVRCGPTVIPKASACYECYFHRLASTRRHSEEFAARGKEGNVLYRPVPSKLSINWAVAMASTQILSHFSGIAPDLHLSPMREIDVLKGDVVKSSLLKLPRCPVCGPGNASRPVSPVINTKLVALKA